MLLFENKSDQTNDFQLLHCYTFKATRVLPLITTLEN